MSHLLNKNNQSTGKKVRISEDVSYNDDENSISYPEASRRVPKKSSLKMDYSKVGEESITQDKVEYFDSLRKQPQKHTSVSSDNQFTPEKETKTKNVQPPKTQNAQKSPQRKISKTTLDLIKKAQTKKQVTKEEVPQQDVTKLLAMPSLRDRFQNISQIKTVKDMLQFTKYSTLVHYFEDIDQMVQFMKQRKQTPFWTQIQASIFECKRVNIPLSTVQNIIAVWPEAYTVTWMINEKIVRIDRWDIILQIVTHSNLENRMQDFKQHLFNYIQSHGEHIEEADLPQRPDKKKAQLVEDYIKDAEAETSKNPVVPKQSRAYQILQKMAEQNKQTSTCQDLIHININKFKDCITQMDDSKLSKTLLEKVREKEKRLKEEQQLQNQNKEIPKECLILTANILFNYYLTRQVSNMFLANVVSYVKDNNKRMILSEQQVIKFIGRLTEMFPNWIKVIENPSGSVLRMDRTVDLPLIFKEIENQSIAK